MTSSTVPATDRQATESAAPTTTVIQQGTAPDLPPLPPPATSPLPTQPIVTVPPTTQPPVSPPVTTLSAGPSTITALISLLGPDPDAYGDRGSNLMDKLEDVEEERAKHGDTDHHVTDAASDLIQDVDKWLQERRLDATIGAHAKRLLAPLAAG